MVLTKNNPHDRVFVDAQPVGFLGDKIMVITVGTLPQLIALKPLKTMSNCFSLITLHQPLNFTI